MHCDEERGLPDGLQDLPLGLGVLGRLPLLDDGGFLQDLHGVEFAGVGPAAFAGEEHFAVGWKERGLRLKYWETFLGEFRVSYSCVLSGDG